MPVLKFAKVLIARGKQNLKEDSRLFVILPSKALSGKIWMGVFVRTYQLDGRAN